VDEHRPKDRGQYATEGYPDEGQGGARSDDWQAGIPPLRARLPTKQACHRGVTLTWPGHGGSRDNTVEHPSPPVVSRPACPSRRPIPNPASVHRGSRRRLWVTLPRVPRPGRATYHTAWTGPRQAGGEERGPGDPRGTSWRMASPPGHPRAPVQQRMPGRPLGGGQALPRAKTPSVPPRGGLAGPLRFMYPGERPRARRRASHLECEPRCQAIRRLVAPRDALFSPSSPPPILSKSSLLSLCSCAAV
jgi:hypothetical protein